MFLIPFLFLNPVFAKSYRYEVEKGDTLGTILLSLGHLKLWKPQGMVNHFQQRAPELGTGQLIRGREISIPEEYIVFKSNVTLKDDKLTFVKKIKTQPEFRELLSKQDAVVPVDHEVSKKEEPAPTKVPPEPSQPIGLSLYPGAGLFLALNQAENNGVMTVTQTGIQPMAQLKGIYSNALLGAFSFDVLAKKIINPKYSFPINLDYRLQYLPQWNVSESYRLALSYSILRHSYVGKGAGEEEAFQLNTQFAGLGFVLPRDVFWFEVYLEKEVSGETKSDTYNVSTKNGWRLDSELIYPIGPHWKIIPGINYFRFEDKSQSYKFHVVETRLIFARQFDL